MYDSEPLRRVDEIMKKQNGYLYGPSLIGNSSYFPTGILGNAMVQQDQDQWYTDAYSLTSHVVEEMQLAADALRKAGGLKVPLDYQHLYINQWDNSVPNGIASGVFTNYSSDLLFSMERLSVNPYAVRRIHPTADGLPFMVADEITRELAGMSLETLHREGRLFLVDHSYQARYPVSPGRYTSACSAYFFIHPKSGDFLPLSIRTNVETNLIYSPLDEETDWLLAKAMFNMNDLFHSQIFHLANSHAVSEIVHLAALRTMSDKHPVFSLLNRLMYQAYAIRPVGEKVLFNEGGFFERSFSINSEGVKLFASEFYPTRAGPFMPNFFHKDLTTRGLLNCTYGPALKSMPFFEDGNVLHSIILKFITSFVEAYYDSDQTLALDNELQAWVREATEAALVIDFPASPLVRRSTLVDILVHVAFLNGVSHHVLNSGEPVATSGVLPLHPSALYAPVPKKKGVKDIMSFLPPVDDAVEQIALFARFNRPHLVSENGTLTHMFNSRELLGRGCIEVRRAEVEFREAMQNFSEVVGGRTFDIDGLSQGMPFVWKGLDPGQIPYFLSV
ncbi:hypothetical protein BCIN_02g06330 [Botrytis cinerea B05.10]|uniref:Manganese lipoxygenase n=1 Tax=Botryotinia fuckeliana (strain B05.10) TaxID=332648 RepID=A0A384J9W9_BOTFB|nr:hypothetical protein BCIN_02g06330 [Botrytis cinerea B05.10]ATZ47343.1 hypothetical protein BCIN_02g06330 [Botrytis cinerea B05.10]